MFQSRNYQIQYSKCGRFSITFNFLKTEEQSWHRHLSSASMVRYHILWWALQIKHFYRKRIKFMLMSVMCPFISSSQLIIWSFLFLHRCKRSLRLTVFFNCPNVICKWHVWNFVFNCNFYRCWGWNFDGVKKGTGKYNIWLKNNGAIQRVFLFRFFFRISNWFELLPWFKLLTFLFQ